MNIILGIVIAYLVLPIVGEILVYYSDISLYSGTSDLQLITHNSIHAAIIIVFAYMATRPKKLQPYALVFKPNLIIYRTMIITIIGFLFIFSTIGYKFLIQGMYRGDIRLSLGWVGLFTTWLIRFLLPAVLALSTICWMSSKKTLQTTKLFYYVTWLFCLLTAISTGYKSSIITMTLPAVSILFFKNRIIGLAIKVVPIALTLLTLTTALVRDIDFYSAFMFLIHRMTVMVAYGTIGVWNHFPEGVEVNESIKLLYNLFGNNIAEYILGHDRTSVEFLSTNLSRLMTYLAYPNTEGALSGTVNVTVTNFGEAFYIFGYYYPVYSIISGFIFFAIIKKFRNSWQHNNLVVSVISLTYIFAVLLPWLNSSSFLILISLPTLIWLVLTIVVIHLIVKVKPLVLN